MQQAIKLARFVTETSFSSFPQPAVLAGKRGFLDCLGTALGGARCWPVMVVADLLAESEAKPQATLLGRGGARASLAHAALINATAAHALDYDDTLSAPTAMTGLAVAEANHLGGRELLSSYILGFEVAHRAASAIGGWDNTRGWHMMGVAGVYGAAVAAGTLLRLTAEQLAHAIGLAATQAAGLVAMHGYPMKPVHSGKAAADGLFAAQLALRGFTSGPALEGPVSIFLAMGGGETPDLINELGSSYAVLKNRLKPYPCGRLGHAAIEVALKVRSTNQIDPQEIVSVNLNVNPRAQYLMGKEGDPQNGAQSMFSIAHGAAAALLFGKSDPTQYTDEAVRDPVLTNLRHRVQVIPDEKREPGQAGIEVEVKNGSRFTAEVLVQKGFVGNPLTDSDVREKFLSLAEPVLGAARSQEVADLVYQMERLDDAGELARLCS